MFADKVIKQEYADEIRRLIGMIDSGTITEEDAAKSLNCSLEEFKKMKDSLL